jgi:hypothetical protein
MIVAVNGRRVGGMMRTEFEYELDISGPNLMLVLSRYKYAESIEDRLRAAEARYQEAFDSVVNDPRRIGCVELVAGAASQSMPAQIRPATTQQKSTRRIESANQGPASGDTGNISATIDLHERQSMNVQLITHQELETRGSSRPQVNSLFQLEEQPPPYHTNQDRSHPDDGKLARKKMITNGANNATDQTTTAEGDVLDFDNAWLGCVCGAIHGEAVPVFWIQCDSCKSWYNVSPQCVSFTERDAKSLSSWTCWGCPSPSQRPTTVGTADPPQKITSPCETGAAPDEATALGGKTLSVLGSLSSETSGVASTCEGLASSLLEAPCETAKQHAEGGTGAEHVQETQKASKKRGRPRKDDGISPRSRCVAKRPTKRSVSAAHPISELSKVVETKSPMRRERRGVNLNACVNPSDHKASTSSATGRVQPSETTDEPMVFYKGGWVPKAGASLHAPPLSLGDRVYVRDSGRPESGVATVIGTYVDDKFGRFYNVKFVVSKYKVKNVHAHFVALHDFQVG